MSLHVFGETDGGPVLEATLRTRAGAEAKILNYGAVLRDLMVPSRNGAQRVTLGLNSIEDYIAHSPSFGAAPGRFANRIANGRFTLDGKAVQLDRKPGEKHTLHGGPKGFGKRLWRFSDHDDHSATLKLESADGDMGFPGALHARCVYTLLEPAILRIELTATCDAPTLVNLTQHAYFNLDGSSDILDHQVQLDCAFYTPADAELIPTGEIRAVEGTAYDFRRARSVRNTDGVTYDTNFVVTARPGEDGMAPVASVKSPNNGLTMTMRSSEPGVQFYDAAKLNCPVPGLGGAKYGAHAGLCLEAQRFPDSPNRRHFTDATLRPGDTYRHLTEYSFA
jgi:aldose 1-epimerase